MIYGILDRASDEIILPGQLLSHFNIFDTLAEGKRLDTVYLDFTEAFDKEDYEKLLGKR